MVIVRATFSGRSETSAAAVTAENKPQCRMMFPLWVAFCCVVAWNVCDCTLVNAFIITSKPSSHFFDSQTNGQQIRMASISLQLVVIRPGVRPHTNAHMQSLRCDVDETWGYKWNALACVLQPDDGTQRINKHTHAATSNSCKLKRRKSAIKKSGVICLFVIVAMQRSAGMNKRDTLDAMW